MRKFIDMITESAANADPKPEISEPAGLPENVAEDEAATIYHAMSMRQQYDARIKAGIDNWRDSDGVIAFIADNLDTYRDITKKNDEPEHFSHLDDGGIYRII